METNDINKGLLEANEIVNSIKNLVEELENKFFLPELDKKTHTLDQISDSIKSKILTADGKILEIIELNLNGLLDSYKNIGTEFVKIIVDLNIAIQKRKDELEKSNIPESNVSKMLGSKTNKKMTSIIEQGPNGIEKHVLKVNNILGDPIPNQHKKQ
ncbi:MAG: hypothetical protein PHS92_00860 [Candidatus Gracilibacteria bacterium]|nr:hypothetical protein [Candidatus Gracilibacteria bacterium]